MVQHYTASEAKMMSGASQTPSSIIDLILADVNAIVPNFNSLVSSYRLLVGAAEEIRRTPGVCPDVFERAVRRYDNTGTLIDILIELLCCKIAFSAQFLTVSCAPVDLFRLLASRDPATDTPHCTAEQVVIMEAVRRVLLQYCHDGPCLPYNPVVCPTPAAKPPAPKPPKTAPPKNSDIAEVVFREEAAPPNSDIAEVVFTEEIAGGTVKEQQFPSPREPAPTAKAAPASAGPEPEPAKSRLRPRHLLNWQLSTKPKR
ncbi:hypothetical protein [Sporolituus thermophilus]|nr:hypothetical protein [Sporolituus thermophilus]